VYEKYLGQKKRVKVDGFVSLSSKTTIDKLNFRGGEENFVGWLNIRQIRLLRPTLLLICLSLLAGSFFLSKLFCSQR